MEMNDKNLFKVFCKKLCSVNGPINYFYNGNESPLNLLKLDNGFLLELLV